MDRVFYINVNNDNNTVTVWKAYSNLDSEELEYNQEDACDNWINAVSFIANKYIKSNFPKV